MPDRNPTGRNIYLSPSTVPLLSFCDRLDSSVSNSTLLSLWDREYSLLSSLLSFPLVQGIQPFSVSTLLSLWEMEYSPYQIPLSFLSGTGNTAPLYFHSSFSLGHGIQPLSISALLSLWNMEYSPYLVSLFFLSGTGITASLYFHSPLLSL